MWAIVKNSQLIEISNGNKPITVGDVVHPKDIFKHWTKSQLKDIGVYEFISGSTPDTRFETLTTPSYKVDDSAGTVTETINKKDRPIADTLYTSQNKTDGVIPEGKDVGDVASKGLKTIYTEQIQNQASDLLVPTDWMVVRKAEDSSKSIPSAVTTFRASVRTEADKIVQAISDCDTLDKLKALFVTEYNEDKSVKTKATMDTLPDDKDIESYKR
tara:strand:- start:2582 stop:3226 length:645 start_codon:yes stop_codon:yes gene_type:complete